jgi:NADPH:quinone reductase-like Zn-dependent oxidoreductase
MKAILFDRHGGADILKYRNVPRPKIHDDEILVQVKACALNHLDIWTRNGLPGIKIPLPHILGCESAGVVREIGKKVKNVKVGEDVLVAPGISCGRCEFCEKNRDSLCPEFNIMGFRCDGGYAEFVKAPAQNAIKISTKNLSYAEWASVPLCFLTAWHMLFTRANLKKGEKVLIHAAGSGVGSAAIQLARWKKAFVITTAGSDEKLKRGKKLGAQEAINYTQKDVAQEVKRITDGRKIV